MPPLTHYRPAFQERELRRSRTSELALRARVLIHAHRLDAMLLEGADPAESPELAARARQLTSMSYRQALAQSIEQILTVAEGRAKLAAALPSVAKHDIVAARAALVGLIQALVAEQTVEPAGVVLAERLLADGLSPLYVEGAHDALRHAASAATAALEGR